MAYLITGGTGLLGSRVVRELIRMGEHPIVYDLHPDKGMMEMVLNVEERSKVKTIEGNVLDFNNLMENVKKDNVEIIIHLAAILGEDIKANPPLGVKVNVDGIMNIFEIAKALHLKKVVWASSSSIFAAGKYDNESVLNDAPHYPLGLYGASKAFGENAADYYFQEFGIDITGLRFGTLYGAGQQRGSSAKLTQELMINPALGKPGRVPGGDGSVALTLADDAARAVLLACRYRRSHGQIGAFNIMGHWQPVRELVGYVKELLPGADMEVLPGNYPGPRVKMDTTVTEEKLGYHPQWSMKEGIKKTINLVRQHHDLPPI